MVPIRAGEVELQLISFSHYTELVNEWIGTGTTDYPPMTAPGSNLGIYVSITTQVLGSWAIEIS